MTWAWRIFFSALVLLPAAAATITGSIELRDSKDPGVRKKSDYSGVVVWLDSVPAAAVAATEPKHARMVQKGKTFTPHVLAIPVGTTVDFPNFDPIFHNAFSSYNGQVFDVGLYPPGSSRSIRFGRVGVVRVFCNIHANMSAVIVVLNTPWFAVSGKDGEWSIAEIPSGDYMLHVFHERAAQATLDGLTRRLAVRGDKITVPPLEISESGYLSIPHKNKFGKDYPAAPDAGSYPSVR